jgi:hypothetical protein
MKIAAELESLLKFAIGMQRLERRATAILRIRAPSILG